MNRPEEWERGFLRPVLKSAEPHPMVFLELLARRAMGRPELIDLFASTMEDMGKWYQEQVAALDGVLMLRRIMREGKEGDGE